jgi:hypothetical protein
MGSGNPLGVLILTESPRRVETGIVQDSLGGFFYREAVHERVPIRAVAEVLGIHAAQFADTDPNRAAEIFERWQRISEVLRN